MVLPLLLTIRPDRVLNALGMPGILPRLPCLCKCPLCQTPHSLEVSECGGVPGYRCYSCGFSADGISLYRAAQQHQTVIDAVQELYAGGVVDEECLSKLELERYIVYNSVSLATRKWWHKVNRRFQHGDPFAKGLLQRMGLYITGCLSTDMLGLELGVANGRYIREGLSLLPVERRGIRANSLYLIAPIWSSPSVIAGFLVFNEETQTIVHTPLDREAEGLGFIGRCQIKRPYTIYTSDPWVVLREILWQGAGGTAYNIAYANSSKAIDTFRSGEPIIYTPDGDCADYRKALDCMPSKVATDRDIQQLVSDPAVSAPSSLNELVCLAALPTHEAIASAICRKNHSQVPSYISGLSLDTVDISRIVSSAPPATREEVASHLKAQLSTRSVSVNNASVMTDPDGWYFYSKAGHKDRIATTTFYVTTLTYEDGLTIANGTIHQGTDSVPFTERWDRVRKKTAQWLTAACVENGLDIPIVAHRWERHLISISIALSKPKTRHGTSKSGWDNDGRILRLPNITIGSGTVDHADPDHAITDSIGQGLGYVRTLTAEQEASLAHSDTAGEVFWSLFVAVACNALKPMHSVGTQGIAIVESCENSLVAQCLKQMSDEIGLYHASFTSGTKEAIEEVSHIEKRSPFPVYIHDRWMGSANFCQWLRTPQNRNCLVQTGPAAAAALSLEGGWIYVTPSGNPSQPGDALRVQGLWRVLPLFLAWVQADKQMVWPNTPYALLGSMFDAVRRWLNTLSIVAGPVLVRASNCCVPDLSGRDAPFGAKFINFLLDCVNLGQLRFRIFDEEELDPKEYVIADHTRGIVFVAESLVNEMLDTHGARSYPRRHVVQSLAAIGALNAETYYRVRGYGIDINYWSMSQSVRPTFMAP